MSMTADEAFEILQFEKELIENAGPAVLRLKLIEIGSLFLRRLAGDDVLEAARTASEELRKLIAERPCVSLIDFKARDKVLVASFGVESSIKAPDAQKSAQQPLDCGPIETRQYAAEIELDQRDAIALDCALNKGYSQGDLREFGFLMSGIFDSPSEPARFVKRANQLAGRTALLGAELKNGQSEIALNSVYKKSA
jgi:hypothetical protein